MSWFDSILNVTEGIGEWMEDNQTAANILGGAVVAGAQYYTSKEAAEQEEKMYERRKSDELELSKASTGSNNYSATLTGGTGLLTNGLLAKRE